MKKGIKLILAGLVMVMNLFSPIFAETNFEENEEYYRNLCSAATISAENKSVCREFAYYISGKSSEMQKKLEEIENNREKLAQDIKAQAERIRGYNAEITVLNGQIKTLNEEIETLQVQIDEKTAELLVKEIEVEALKERIKSRMEQAQGTMRLNQYLDFIMGSESLTDLIRRINGVNDIMSYDNVVQIELKDLIEYLALTKQQLEESKTAVESKKGEVIRKQEEVMIKQHEAEIIQEEYLRQEAEFEAQGNQIMGDLAAVLQQIRDISDKIDEIIPSSGFSKPVKPGSAYVSANTWHYPSSSGSLSGGVHLGMDLAGPVGTDIYAVANGVIIKSVDGCANDGYLGNGCGAAQGGTSGGGNQILQLAEVNGVLYAIKYLHLSPGTLIGNAITVVAGQKIAEMGKSGNVTGPHLHIEVYKLGTMRINAYLSSWDGNLSFGCGWGNAALNRTCSKSGTPCRMRPEEVLGY